MEGSLRLVNVAACCFLLLFLATIGALIPTKLLEANKNGSIIYPESFYLVGMADGKAFFVDNDNYMNWTAAKAYCESMNMQLASITSEAQATMLNKSYDEDKFFSIYWTSARDVIDLRQFVWNYNLKQPDSAYVTQIWGIGIASCLYYYSNNGTSDVRSAFCTSTNIRPMCDTENLNNYE